VPPFALAAMSSKDFDLERLVVFGEEGPSLIETGTLWDEAWSAAIERACRFDGARVIRRQTAAAEGSRSRSHRRWTADAQLRVGEDAENRLGHDVGGNGHRIDFGVRTRVEKLPLRSLGTTASKNSSSRFDKGYGCQKGPSIH